MFISIISIGSGVLLILLFLLMIISTFQNKLTDSVIVLTFMILALLGAFNIGMGVVSLLEHKETIQPIEVYRGNTELRIETREINGEVVSCDTVVVRKK
jgi:hypothetical protein